MPPSLIVTPIRLLLFCREIALAPSSETPPSASYFFFALSQKVRASAAIETKRLRVGFCEERWTNTYDIGKNVVKSPYHSRQSAVRKSERKVVLKAGSGRSSDRASAVLFFCEWDETNPAECL